MNYSKEVMKNFMKPKNMGDVKNANGVGEVGNAKCGDVMKISIKVKKDKKGNEVIREIKFKTFGCMAAIATSSMVTQLAKDKDIKVAEKLTRADVSKSLKGLPPLKEHCSNLASDALKKAIEDYRKKSK